MLKLNYDEMLDHFKENPLMQTKIKEAYEPVDKDTETFLVDEQGNVDCENCIACTNCIGCKDCIRCELCSYCGQCTDCKGCSFYVQSTNCVHTILRAE